MAEEDWIMGGRVPVPPGGEPKGCLGKVLSAIVGIVILAVIMFLLLFLKDWLD